MTLASIPHGTSLFLDVNTFVYYFGAHPQFGAPCKQLLERIARQELHGLTSTHVLGDVLHRMMTQEAMGQFGWPAKGIAHRLRQHPAEVQKLSRFQQTVAEIRQMGIQVLSVHLADMDSAAALCRQHGLLLGDGLIVAMMRQPCRMPNQLDPTASSGGKTPSAISCARCRTRCAKLMPSTAMVARPTAVRPTRIGPSQRK
jgi:predicted nucleic acid-binding protein